MWKEGTDLVIKRSVYNIGRCCLLFILLLLSVFYIGFYGMFLLIEFGFLVVLVNMLNCLPIKIGKDGIKGKKLKQLSWEQIDAAYISQQIYKSPRYPFNTPETSYRRIYYFLNVQFHDENGERKWVKIDLEEYSFHQDEVERAINYWSGGKIGDSSRYDDCVASNEG